MKTLILASLLLSTAAFADERILSFHSDIRVFADGMIEVTETIQVRAEGNQIRRGIYRDLPVEYLDRLGNNYEVTIEPLAVLRNEMPESYKVVRNRRDIRPRRRPGIRDPTIALYDDDRTGSTEPRCADQRPLQPS